MSVQAGSRYVNTPVVNQTVSNQTRQVLVPGPQTGYSFAYTAYMVTGKDRLDTMANDFYGSSLMWWHIAQGNPEVLDWSNLPPGSVIRVPVI